MKKLYHVTWYHKGIKCEAWIEVRHFKQLLSKCDKELIGFDLNKVGFEFTSQLVNDKYIGVKRELANMIAGRLN